MANQTVSSDANHDTLTGRAAGEDFTITSGATLTIDSMPHLTPSGILGDITLTSGTLHIDGRYVKEITYSSGSGTIPTAIPTSITWDGGASTGKIIRYNSGDSTSGTLTITVQTGTLEASDTITDGSWSATVDTVSVGFLIIYGEDQDWGAADATNTLRITGDWYQIGVGDGTNSQVLTLPHTGHQPAIWVETGDGTGIFEIWHRVVPSASTIFYNNISQFGTTFESGFVFDQSFGSATVTFGTTTAGGVPPNNARIRIPNVHIGTTTTVAPTTEINSATITNHIGLIAANTNLNVTIDHLNGSSCYVDFRGTNAVSISDSCWGLHTNDILINKVNAAVEITNCAIIDGAQGIAGSYLPVQQLQITDNIGGITITDSVIMAGENANSGYALGLITMANLDFKGVCKVISNQQDENTMYAIRATTGSNITAETLIVLGGPLSCATSSNNWVVDELIFGLPPGRGTGEQNLINALTYSASKGCVIQSGRLATGGAKFATGGIFLLTDSDEVTIRNFGEANSKIDCGARGTYILTLAGISTNVILQRVWFTNNTSTESFVFINSAADITIENCSGAYNDPLIVDANRVLIKGIHGASGDVGTSTGVEDDFVNCLASIFYDIFKSDTTGAIGLTFNDRGVKHQSDVSIDSGNPSWNGLGDLLMPSTSDQVTFTFPYQIKGHTGFQNALPHIIGVNAGTLGTNWGNFSIEYALDTGSGYGSFKTATGANLSGETISATGFGLKIRIKVVTASATNNLRGLQFHTTTTLTDQSNNLYPLDTVDLNITVKDESGNAIQGATVAIYQESNMAELMNETSNSSGLATQSYNYQSDTAIIVRVRKSSTGGTKYIPYNATGTMTSNGFSLVVTLIEDSIIGD